MINSGAPFERPPALTARETSFYEDELERFNAILDRPYGDFAAEDAEFLLETGELFIPRLYVRYFFPAIAEAAAALVAASPAGWNLERIARLARVAAPVEPLESVCSDLRSALRVAPARPRPTSSYLEVPNSLASPFPAGHGESRVLALLLELQGDSRPNRDLLDSEEPSIQLTVVAFSRGVLEGGWRLVNEGAAALWSPELIVRRLQQIKTSRYSMAALAARFVLGEVTRSELPACGDPECVAHSVPVHR